MVCGRVIEGKVLELYRELTDSPTDTLLEACVLSAIFALRYLSRDIAANLEQADVGFYSGFSSGRSDVPNSQYWKFGDEKNPLFSPSQKRPFSPR